MKKVLHLLFAVVALMGLSSQAAAQLFIIGEVEGAGWSANLGVPMTETSTANEYEITIQVNGTFGFATQLGSSADDWDGLNANRYGGEYDPYPIQSGVTTTLYKSSAAFQIANAGEYHIVVNMDAMTVVATATTAVELPTSMYVIGTVDDCTWTPNQGVEMTAGDEEGVFTATCTVNGGAGDGVNSLGYFAFASQLGADENDWDGLNANRYGANAYNKVLAPEVATLLVKNPNNSFAVAGGEYTMTVDLNANTVTVVPTGEIEYNFPDVIYMVGCVEGGTPNWDSTTTGLAIAESEDTPGVYNASITVVENGYFGFVAALTETEGDWDSFNVFRYVPAGDAELAVGTSADFVMNGGDSFYIAPGTYNCTITLTSIGAGSILFTEPVSVDEIGSDVAAARPLAGKGEISIVGDAADVDVYTVGGALIASGDIETVNCTAGVYVVVIDGIAHKVIVR